MGSRPRYPFSTRHAAILRGIKSQLAIAGMNESQLQELHCRIGFDESDPVSRKSVASRFSAGTDHRPTGVICEADGIARFLYGVLQDGGIRIPDEVSIVGFGELTSVLDLDPPLTSTAWPLRRLGEHGVRLILARAREPRHTPVRIVLEAPLTLRGSTGPAR